jgi:hypothetical protein
LLDKVLGLGILIYVTYLEWPATSRTGVSWTRRFDWEVAGSAQWQAFFPVLLFDFVKSLPRKVVL